MGQLLIKEIKIITVYGESSQRDHICWQNIKKTSIKHFHYYYYFFVFFNFNCIYYLLLITIINRLFNTKQKYKKMVLSGHTMFLKSRFFFRSLNYCIIKCRSIPFKFHTPNKHLKNPAKQWVCCSLLDGDADMVSCNKSTWFVNYIMTIRPKLGEQMSCLGWWSAETWQHLIAFLYLWANFTGHLCLLYTNTACAVFQSWCGFYVKAFQGLACLLVIEHARETDIVWQTEDLCSLLHSFVEK